MSGKRIPGNCPYNEGITCEKKDCERGVKCGWFPMVERYRKEKIAASGVLNHVKPIQKVEKQKNNYSRDFSAERKKRLIAAGNCPICGGKNNRPDRYCCSACYERQKAARKAKELIFS